MPRFVILRHDHPDFLHWDFMLELPDEDTLATWSLPAFPELGVQQVATQLPDHRTAYLTYEGEVSGNRGTVTRVEQGQYELVRTADTHWCVQIFGEALRGFVTLDRMDQGDTWNFEFVLDFGGHDCKAKTA